MFEFITDAIDKITIFFTAVIAFVKTLPTGTDGIGTNHKRGIVM
jgi:hypothetical protein